MSCHLNIWSHIKQNTQFYAKSVNDNTLIESNFLSQHISLSLNTCSNQKTKSSLQGKMQAAAWRCSSSSWTLIISDKQITTLLYGQKSRSLKKFSMCFLLFSFSIYFENLTNIRGLYPYEWRGFASWQAVILLLNSM